MDERGWGWTPTEIRQAQIVEWIVRQSGDTYVPVKPFYDEQADQDALTLAVVHGELHDLARRSLINLAAGTGGIESYHALATPEARRLVEELHAKRADKRRRRQACRDAMVAWLHSLDATRPDDMAIRDKMLADTRHGIWFAEPFSDTDVEDASAWLKEKGLVDGIEIGECNGPVHLYLTEAGIDCAEKFDSYTDSYLQALQWGPAGGDTFNFSGPTQFAGDNARQVQNIGMTPEQVQNMIAGIVEIVVTAVPRAAGADEAKRLALAAVSESSVDRSALERFGAWAISTVKTGASSGVVAVISSATTTLLMNIGHLVH